MSDFIRDTNGALAHDLASELAAAESKLADDVRVRTEHQFAVADRIRAEIARLKTLHLVEIDDSAAELLAMGAERALNPFEPKDGNDNGPWVGGLRRNLSEARRIHNELVRRLESDLLKLERPAQPNHSHVSRIRAIKAEMQKREAREQEEMIAFARIANKFGIALPEGSVRS